MKGERDAGRCASPRPEEKQTTDYRASAPDTISMSSFVIAA